jgi:tRNA A37 threonylcarbamoyladenosine biosynthesis protein TsaE
LGVSERVTSPTFVLVHEHRLAGQPRDPAPDRLIHVDLYRVAAAAAADLGVADTAAEAGVLVVEWAERARGLFGADALEATLEIVPAGRRIAFAPGGPLSAAWLRRALEDLTIADLERDGGEAEA